MDEEARDNKRTILITDDDSFLLDMYASRFTQAGYEVTTSESALATLEKLRDGTPPDVLLMDVVMPSMDGFELLEAINAERLANATVKIFLTNLGTEADVARGKSLGAASYIVKANSTPSEVVTTVDAVLRSIHS